MHSINGMLRIGLLDVMVLNNHHVVTVYVFHLFEGKLAINILSSQVEALQEGKMKQNDKSFLQNKTCQLS